MIYFKIDDERNITIRWMDGGTLQIEETIIDSLQIEFGCDDKISPNGYITYRRNYGKNPNNDTSKLDKDLAGLNFNLDKLFPCIANNDTLPACKVNSYKEDGFAHGRALLQSTSRSSDFGKFGTKVKSFGFTHQNCPHLFGEESGCLPNDYEVVIVFHLPYECICD
jgi:hypothetical protein